MRFEMVSKGDIINGYTIKKRLGSGGQGNVWSAQNVGKHFALKFLNNADDEQARLRFAVEFKALKMLKDKRIIKVHEFFKDSKEELPPYIVMELIVGSDLETESLKGSFRLDILSSLNLFKEIVTAVNIAHENNPQVLHRDLKPANILLRKDNSPVVTDFGICLVVDDRFMNLTRVNEEVGARNYIAKELRGSFQNEPTPQSDIYSLGKVLYFMLSGGKIMDGEEYKDPRYDLRNWTGCPKQMDYVYKLIFDKCITESPKDRFTVTNELLITIDKIIELVEGKYSPVQPGRKCILCGEGEYGIFRPATGNYAGSFFVCDHCGNMQFFSIRFHEDNFRKSYDEDPIGIAREFNNSLPKPPLR